MLKAYFFSTHANNIANTNASTYIGVIIKNCNNKNVNMLNRKNIIQAVFDFIIMFIPFDFGRGILENMNIMLAVFINPSNTDEPVAKYNG